MKINKRVSLFAAAVLAVAPMASASASAVAVCDGAYRLVGSASIDWSRPGDYPPLTQTVTLAPGKTSLPPRAYELTNAVGYREDSGEMRHERDRRKASGQHSYPAKPLQDEIALSATPEAGNCSAFHTSALKVRVVCPNGKTEQAQIRNEFADCRQAGG